MTTPLPLPGVGPAAPTKIITQAGVDAAKKKSDAAKKKITDAAAKKKALADKQKAAVAKKAAAVAAKKPKPKLTATQKYLSGDTTYQQQLSEYNAEKSAYKTKYNRQNQITNRDYNTSQRSANRAATQDRLDQKNDFAGRGILHSGVYAQALGNYNTDFNTKMANLLQGKTDALGTAKGDYNDFLRQLSLQMNSAKQDAVRRRSASLGI